MEEDVERHAQGHVPVTDTTNMTHGRIRRGRPPKVSDQTLVANLPGPVHVIADAVGLERSACYYRLRCLEAEGVVFRDRSRNPHIWRRR